MKIEKKKNGKSALELIKKKRKRERVSGLAPVSRIDRYSSMVEFLFAKEMSI